MSIATSIEKLSETLTNCKANLKEKEVADVDNIKISDVDEKIAEIKSGSSENKYANVTSFKVNNSEITDLSGIMGKDFEITLDKNVRGEDFYIYVLYENYGITVNNLKMTKSTKLTVNGNKLTGTLPSFALDGSRGYFICLILLKSNDDSHQIPIYVRQEGQYGE